MEKKDVQKEFELSGEELEKATGGIMSMTNPAAGISREQAEAIAREFGDGKDMGSWKTMSGEQFLKWWEASNGKNQE